MKRVKLFFLLIILITIRTFAEAPVVDLNQVQSEDETNSQQMVAQAPVVDSSVPSSIDTTGMSTQQRLNRLEQQMNNFTQMNMTVRIDQLQQQVQQLQGQLEEQNHQLQTLQDQQKNFYQDINQRFNQLQLPPGNTGGKVSVNNTTPGKVSASNANDESTYQNAFSLLANKKYDQALTGLQNYLKAFPKGKYASNAYYWLGELYFMQKKPDDASQQFQTLMSLYPKDQKVPDARLKLAMIHDNAGKHSQARNELRQIVKQYPGTPAAQLAAMRLKAMATSP